MPEENLDEFADYLAEFEDHFFFDKEGCPKCGISFSNRDGLDDSLVLLSELETEHAKILYSGLAASGIVSSIKISLNGCDLIIYSKDRSKAERIIELIDL